MNAPVEIAGACVGVLGLGRSGTAVSRLLARHGATVYASDVSSGKSQTVAAQELEAEGIEAEIGGHDASKLAACDWFAISPGIPPDATVLVEPPVVERPYFGELEVASWFASAPIAAVTGTNGKTTTTALLGSVLTGAGVAASVAGNIGRPFSAAVLEDHVVEWFVLEVSSFQLASIATFRPRVAVVLNLTADHLDTYPDLDAYAGDKARIAMNQGAGDHLCLDAETPELADFGADRAVARHWFDRRRRVSSGAWIDAGEIRLTPDIAGGGVVGSVSDLGIPGAHNVQNALGASLTAALIGAAPDAIRRGLATFQGVPHRLETVGVVDGVAYINDSKATNVESTGVALEAFDRPLIVILGGRHKGSPYAPLREALRARARAVLAIGEAAPRIVADLGEEVEVSVVETLDRAVEEAHQRAESGDVVLLSPACSSYDQFPSFEHRGERFRDLVAGLDGVA